MAITDTQAKINDIINKSMSANASTLGDIMRDDVASGMQDLLNEIVTMLVDIGDLDVTKLEKGTYTGNASDLKSYLEGLISACTQKGTYSGTAGQLKAMIDSLATTGTITPDLKNYMELLKDENGVKVVQGVPVGGQKYLGTYTGTIRVRIPDIYYNSRFKARIKIFSLFNGTNLDTTGVEFIVTGVNYNLGFNHPDVNQGQQVMVLSSKKFNYNVAFCNGTGARGAYILIGDLTTKWQESYVVVDDLSGTIVSEKDWEIFAETTIEELSVIYKCTVTPSLNATHMNGTMTSNMQGGITQKKTSTMSLEVENDAGTTFFNVDTTIGKVTQRIPTTTTPTNNQEMEFQLTSNTQLTIKVKGTDGVVRSANITLS